MTTLATNNVYDLPATPPDLAARLGIDVSEIVKLDANENPYGPSPAALRALQDVAANRYPDPGATPLREAIGSYLNLSPDKIVVGNGSDELIELLCRLLLVPGDEVVTCPPTFSLYAIAARTFGAQVLDAARGENFAFDLSTVQQAVSTTTKIIFLCSPNNPTGDSISESDLRAVLDLGPLVVMDEAYAEFSGSTFVPLMQEYSNLAILRTFSKGFGLAGLRVGYGIFPPDLARSLRNAKLPYNANAAGQAAALAALGDIPWLETHIALLKQERDRLFAELGALPGLTPLPSAANFLLVRVTAGGARSLYTSLLNRGIMVRYSAQPPLQDYLRITVGTPNQNDKLLGALRSILNQEA
jgi:histidinol-phosphate aminotransferase